MINAREIKICIKELIKKHNIKVKDSDYPKIIELLSNYINYLIFNMVSVACAITLSLGVRKLISEHVKHLESYVDKRCGKYCKLQQSQRMRGGVFNTAAFYGVNEPQYSVANKGTDLMNIDWDNNLVRRPLMTTMSGGAVCAKLNKIIFKEIGKVFKFFKISVNKNIKNDFVIFFHKYMDQMLNSVKGELTYIKMKSLIDKSKIMKKHHNMIKK
jgi:hypothetical protein